MAGKLSQRQTNVIIAGAVFVVCFLSYSFVLSPKRKELKDLKSVVLRLEQQHEEIGRIERQYNELKRDSDPLRERILQRQKGFDLSAFVATTERLQNFTRQRQTPPHSETYGNFEKHSSTFTDNDKTLPQIKDFLREIEKPENVVSVEWLAIVPANPRDPSRLKLDIRLATVVPAKEK
jgi:hypothetical protein